MKGIIFNELQEMVSENFGEDAWDALIDGTELKTADGIFLGPNTYPAEDLMAIVTTASKVTDTPINELVVAFGQYIFPKLAQGYPVFLKEGMTAKSFLLTVHDIIHVEVHKLFPDANLPQFTYEDEAADRLVMLYKSELMLCDLVEGLLAGVGKHFGEEIEINHSQCTKNGDPHCRFELQFKPLG